MTTQAKTSRPLDTPQIPVQFKLAAAWTSFMFFYIYVDYLFLYKPGVVENILAGIVWEFEISETFVTTSIALLAIPILMIVLSMTLPARVNRATNIVAATLYIPFSIFNAVGESWTYFFGLSIGLEVLLLAFILRSAWTWPRTSLTADAAATADRLQLQVRV